MDAAGRDDHGNVAMNEIADQCRYPIVVTLRPTVLNGHVAAFTVAGFLQAETERSDKLRARFGKTGAGESDDRHCTLLRRRREWPRGHRAAEKR